MGQPDQVNPCTPHGGLVNYGFVFVMHLDSWTQAHIMSPGLEWAQAHNMGVLGAWVPMAVSAFGICRLLDGLRGLDTQGKL